MHYRLDDIVDIKNVFCTADHKYILLYISCNDQELAFSKFSIMYTVMSSRTFKPSFTQHIFALCIPIGLSTTVYYISIFLTFLIFFHWSSFSLIHPEHLHQCVKSDYRPQQDNPVSTFQVVSSRAVCECLSFPSISIQTSVSIGIHLLQSPLSCLAALTFFKAVKSRASSINLPRTLLYPLF